MEQTTDEEKHLDPNLLKAIRKLSNLNELIYETALMRFYQKSFFKERENAKLKQDYLQKSKQHEKKVDALLEDLWPGKTKIEQQKLF